MRPFPQKIFEPSDWSACRLNLARYKIKRELAGEEEEKIEQESAAFNAFTETAKRTGSPGNRRLKVPLLSEDRKRPFQKVSSHFPAS